MLISIGFESLSKYLRKRIQYCQECLLLVLNTDYKIFESMYVCVCIYMSSMVRSGLIGS